MIRGLVIREAQDADVDGIRDLLTDAFAGTGEALLVERLRLQGDRVLELVATHEGTLVGELFFSRLEVAGEHETFPALALAPLAVTPGRQRTGIGTALVENAHHMLQVAGERLSVVLGDAAYYGRFGYCHARAAGFDSDYQCEHLQALAWGEAPTAGRLRYASAFAGL